MASRDAVSVNQLYQKLELIGKGTYGSVYKAREVATGNLFALKIINLDTEDDDVADIQHEVNLLSQLRGGEKHNITMYYGCYLDGPRVWIVMDLASGGSVRTLMKATKNNIIEERFTVIVVRECLIAFAFLHRSGVIHRDVKAANVLVTETGRVVVCDFGVSAVLGTKDAKRMTFVGTPHWMAPEVITSGARYDSKADIWSLGITIYEMITGAPPHGDQLNIRAIALIPKAKPPRLPEAVGSKDMKEFVSSCLREVADERPSAEELSKSKWIKSSKGTPVSYLRELLKLYENWARQGGTRQSLAGGDFDWEAEAE
ncbi:Pkinase-domain-containing protein [Clavulina sp. PMI_390]|nr:Pkinase-domain-containing protein [Clavulina sp. PMI_390]